MACIFKNRLHYHTLCSQDDPIRHRITIFSTPCLNQSRVPQTNRLYTIWTTLRQVSRCIGWIRFAEVLCKLKAGLNKKKRHTRFDLYRSVINHSFIEFYPSVYGHNPVERVLRLAVLNGGQIIEKPGCQRPDPAIPNGNFLTIEFNIADWRNNSGGA